MSKGTIMLTELLSKLTAKRYIFNKIEDYQLFLIELNQGKKRYLYFADAKSLSVDIFGLTPEFSSFI